MPFEVFVTIRFERFDDQTDQVFAHARRNFPRQTGGDTPVAHALRVDHVHYTRLLTDMRSGSNRAVSITALVAIKLLKIQCKTLI